MRHLLLIMRKKTPRNYAKFFLSLTENISNRTLNFISKRVECVSQIFFKLQGTIMNLESKLSVFQITVCETAVTKIYPF